MNCDECGREILKNHDYFKIKDKIYCSFCCEENFKKYYFYCMECDRDFKESDHFYFIDQKIYCKDCLYDDFCFTNSP